MFPSGYPRIKHNLFSLDIHTNKWTIHFVHPEFVRGSMCLAVHENQLLCLVHRDFMVFWSCDIIPYFEPYMFPLECTNGYLEDGSKMCWTLVRDLTSYINRKCSGYLPFHATGNKILMYKFSQAPLLYYDLQL